MRMSKIVSRGKSALLLGALLGLSGCASFVGGNLVEQGEATGTIQLQNASGIPIDVVTISRCNAMSHGFSRLSSNDVIQNGQSRTWTVGAGCWDVGAGRTGSCSAGGCSWNEAYQKVTVAAGRISRVTFTASQ